MGTNMGNLQRKRWCGVVLVTKRQTPEQVPHSLHCTGMQHTVRIAQAECVAVASYAHTTPWGCPRHEAIRCSVALPLPLDEGSFAIRLLPLEGGVFCLFQCVWPGALPHPHAARCIPEISLNRSLCINLRSDWSQYVQLFSYVRSELHAIVGGGLHGFLPSLQQMSQVWGIWCGTQQNAIAIP